MEQQSTPSSAQNKLVDSPVHDQNGALNVMVSFLNLAQKRGTFTIDESAKIWECIKMFSGR
jgi:hypothetical protein